MEVRAPNTTRRWWLGQDLVTEADAKSQVLTPRETLMGKGRLPR